jgi:hypothetical protein
MKFSEKSVVNINLRKPDFATKSIDMRDSQVNEMALKSPA